MTPDELRLHFDLRKCPNKRHEFQFGKIVGEWILAQDSWSQLQDEHLQTFIVSFHKIVSVDGLCAYSIVLWRLKIIWGRLK